MGLLCFLRRFYFPFVICVSGGLQKFLVLADNLTSVICCQNFAKPLHSYFLPLSLPSFPFARKQRVTEKLDGLRWSAWLVFWLFVWHFELYSLFRGHQ